MSVLKTTVEIVGAKINVSRSSDDWKDLKDEQVEERVWTGVRGLEERGGKDAGPYSNVERRRTVSASSMRVRWP
jgi:hypothetical protein